MRLKLVSDINAIREQRGVAALSYDPTLSTSAQQQAHYDTEANLGGLATAKFAPINTRTNMWAETTGVGPSWTEIWGSVKRSIEKEKANSYKNPVPTLSWSIGADTGQGAPAPVFSPDFTAIGVGYQVITPDESVITFDVTGPPRANGNSWDSFPPDTVWLRLTDKTRHTSVGGAMNIP